MKWATAYILIFLLSINPTFMHSIFLILSLLNLLRYKIFVAEVASTVNEQLLFHHLMGTSHDTTLQAYLLNHLCDEFKGTVFR